MNTFIADKQTLDDLNILGRYKTNSIFSLFNRTITNGGSRLMERMFQSPLSNASEINSRSEIISFFERIKISLPFKRDDFELVENYLHSGQHSNRLLAVLNLFKVKMKNFLINDKEFTVITNGLIKTVEILSKIQIFVDEIEESEIGGILNGVTDFRNRIIKIKALFTNRNIGKALKYKNIQNLKFIDLQFIDYILRSLYYEQLNELLNDIYELDVYIAVSDLSREKGFGYANAVDKLDQFIQIKGVSHPCIPGAIPNDIYICKEKNVLFLTGANMAGKSTLMKSFGTAVYLAHMGFPVSAAEMSFSVHDGIYSSINVPDNLDMGYSHFYAEVLRVKHVAQEVASGKQLVIIFDELFKGTNVKDAYDGTVSIIDAFSKKGGSFIISTHIMEAGEYLKQSNDKIFFKYLPTIMNGHTPTYPYILADGITDDRHGMIIIQNEKLIEIINS